MDAIPLCFNIEVYVFMSITQQKVVKISTIFWSNAWRHVLAVLTAIFRPTYSTDQVQIVCIQYRIRAHIVCAQFVPDLYYKLA